MRLPTIRVDDAARAAIKGISQTVHRVVTEAAP